MSESLAQHLRARLLRCGQTQLEIAAGSGITLSSVSRFMRAAQVPSLTTYERLLAWCAQAEADDRARERRKQRAA